MVYFQQMHYAADQSYKTSPRPKVSYSNPHRPCRSATGKTPPDQFYVISQPCRSIEVIEVWCRRASCLDPPRAVELRLELMPPVCSDGVDPKGEFFDDIINKFDGTLLIMLRVYLKCSNRGCIINSCILITANLMPFFVFQPQKFHIDLNMMPGHCFSVALCVERSSCGCFWQAINAIASQDTLHTWAWNTNPMISLQVPHDALRT